MDKKTWIRAALPAFLFGLCMIRPQMQVSAANAQAGVTSVGSIVYEDSAGSAAIYAEDIVCLKEKLSSVRAEVYNPGSYRNIQRWEYEILPENTAPKAEYPAPAELPALSGGVNLPEAEETQETEEISAPQTEEMPGQEESSALPGEMKEPQKTEMREPEEAPAPADTEAPGQERSPAPEDAEIPGQEQPSAPSEETQEPEDEKTPRQEETSAPEDTEDKGGAENQ